MRSVIIKLETLCGCTQWIEQAPGPVMPYWMAPLCPRSRFFPSNGREVIKGENEDE